MQKVSLFIILAVASCAVAAQQNDRPSAGAATEQQQTRSDQNTQGADTKGDQPVTERARTEGAAGGTAPVPPERRQAVGAGAGPHLHDHRLGKSQDIGRDDVVQPPK